MLRLTDLFATASMHQWLMLSSAFNMTLLAGRMIATGNIEYIFLPWNLFLAFIPYFLTRLLTSSPGWIERKKILLPVLAVWLLFIPNSFYIITDLYHLTHVDTAAKWYDLLMIFSFAWTGLLFGVLSLRKVELIVLLERGRRFSVLFVLAVLWLCAFGIYIGRFLRFNSWDVLADPLSLAGEIGAMLFHPGDHAYAWGMTFCYAAFMTMLYFTTRRMGENSLV